MSTIQRSPRAAFGIALMLAGALVTPMAATAEDQVLAAAPAVASWDETSGYGSVEASRAAASTVLADDPSWDVTSGYGAVEASRARESAMLVPSATSSQVAPEVRWAPGRWMAADLAHGRGDPRAANLATARAWDETSGYGAVEANRANQ